MSSIIVAIRGGSCDLYANADKTRQNGGNFHRDHEPTNNRKPPSNRYPPHRSLQKLSQKHGHIMSLWLGNVPAIVVSSPQAATLFLKTHGLKMADRPKIQAFEYLTYGTKGMAFSNMDPRWRNTRRICNLNLLSSSKIESFASLRKGEIGLLVQSLKKSAETSEVVDISSKINEVVADISAMMILGRRRMIGMI
ncbi:hypothetical protein FNV43_RR00645 [Rhamnella rubrinervis]|uniref:Cytochrome P450 n=1 Tax=Rhamnella rubrinervis TaxID=2594499 RepID=A0A8K0HN84_9ROSA|nr:hypothetical protein FNV43_RR00645 [Rhamnella rubrinervis]